MLDFCRKFFFNYVILSLCKNYKPSRLNIDFFLHISLYYAPHTLLLIKTIKFDILLRTKNNT